MPNLHVIVASTRPGRVGLPVATWVARAAAEHGAFDVDLIDLADYDLPLMDEPNHPRLRQYTHEHTKRWSATVDRADAFVIVHPEYNYSFNAAIKNAVDYLHQEWADKPVGFVSYGGISGGLRATQALKQVVTTLRMVPVVEAVPIPLVGQYLNDDGEFVPGEPIAAGAAPMFTELFRLHQALAPLRKRD
jgi:NAD(P)H-dependent FMN reductase